MMCFSNQQFCIDSSDDVHLEVNHVRGYAGPVEMLTIRCGYVNLVISGAPGIAQALIEKLAIEVAASNAVRNADHAERAMLKDEEVRA